MRRSTYKHKKIKNKKFKEGKRKYRTKKKDIIKKVKVKTINDPIKRAIDEYNNTHKGYICKYYDDSLIVRITLNYIRHYFTNYDEILKLYSEKDYEFNGFKGLVNEKIMKKYRNYFEDINEWALKDIMKSCID